MTHLLHQLLNVFAQLPEVPADGAALRMALNVVLGILGAVSFLFMTIAGVQFVLSSGNPEKIAKARNAILYGAIGLLVALSAGVTVNFIIGRVR